jgi:transposase-like protein
MSGNGGGPDPLDEDFPLGDGIAQQAAEVSCPYCGEWSTIRIDPGSGPHQSYVEDCPVCCRPWEVRVTYLADGEASVELRVEDEG